MAKNNNTVDDILDYLEYLESVFDGVRPEKDKNDGNFYKIQDYQVLEQNLIRHKEGNREATEYIIKVFHPFITKYALFITQEKVPYTKYTKNGGEYNCISQTIKSFVSIFVDKERTKGMSKKAKFHVTCLRIYKLFSKYEFDDIYNELVLALLAMANRYKIRKPGDKHYKPNGDFHMYVLKCFHWEAYRALTKLIKDPLTHMDVTHLDDQFVDLEYEESSEPQYPDTWTYVSDYHDDYKIVDMQRDREIALENAKCLKMKERKNIDIMSDEVLNFNWVNGITCSDKFKKLSPYEREILLMHYVEKKNDTEIGKRYNVHRTTIHRHRHAALKKIDYMIKEDNTDERLEPTAS